MFSSIELAHVYILNKVGLKNFERLVEEHGILSIAGHSHTLRPSYFCSELSPSRYTSGSDYEMDWPQRLHSHETLRRNLGRVEEGEHGQICRFIRERK